MAKVSVNDLVTPLYDATRLILKLKPQPTSALRFTTFCNQPSHVGESKQADVAYWVSDEDSDDIHIRCKQCEDLTMDMILNPAATVENTPVNESADLDKIKPTTKPVDCLPIDSITVDQRLQARMEKELDPQVVSEYAELMRDGVVFPPVVVFYDGQTRWLAEGFHRIEAAKRAGFTSIPVTVIDGDFRAAMLHSLGSNAKHGKKSNAADMRHAVKTMLDDPEWSSWSDRKIAEQCRVSHEFVRKLRSHCQPLTVSEVTASPPVKERTFTTKHGTTAKMKTGNIGKKVKTDAEIKDARERKALKAIDDAIADLEIINTQSKSNFDIDGEPTESDESEFITNIPIGVLPYGMEKDVFELIETHNIPAEYHVELIEAAKGWAVNSDASNREGTSVAVKGFAWWDEKSGNRAKRFIEMKRQGKEDAMRKKFGQYPFETTAFHFLENLRVGNSGPMADLKRCAEHFDSLDRERLERFKKILADIRQAHNEGMDELESSIDALLRPIEKDITPTDKLLTNR